MHTAISLSNCLASELKHSRDCRSRGTEGWAKATSWFKGEAEQTVEVFSCSGVSRVALQSLGLVDQTLLPVEEASPQLRPREEFFDGQCSAISKSSITDSGAKLRQLLLMMSMA